MDRSRSRTDSRSRDAENTLAISLLLYQVYGNKYTLVNPPGLPICPGSPFWYSLRGHWEQHGSHDAIPYSDLVQAVAEDIARTPQLKNFAIYRSWTDRSEGEEHVYVVLRRQPTLRAQNSNGETLSAGILTLGSGVRSVSPRQNRFLREGDEDN